MTNPNTLVEQRGQTVTLERVTSPVFDGYDELDEAASTIETVDILAILSNPSENDMTRAEGRMGTPTYRMTVDSNTDIKADRTGRPDRVQIGSTWFEVGEVQDDLHPMTGTEKKTVVLDSLPGR